MSFRNKTIKLSLENYTKLAQLGTLEDSFDTVVGRLLGKYHQEKQKQLEIGIHHQAQESQKIQP
jgi:predicted CopG family antitoxin